ncbi:unnamed protein product [Strongylus vulgaris]|uniref:X-box-binding protein 1 n=1 Tax=Strongylus vulgaris TaxID=40348 RepID=A0A3P7JNW0_STRVU|nr:unnamed protein product [Strongylus vulgaris]
MSVSSTLCTLSRGPDVVAQPTIAIPRPLAPTPRIATPTSRLQKPTTALKRPPLGADPIEILLGETPQPHQRKRECLDHLTHEQKMNRRKMKNRIAAQTARDRKKRLEDVVRELLEQNEALKQENGLLRLENQELTEQNNNLMRRLSALEDVQCEINPRQSTVIYEEVPEMVPETSGAAVESAAFISGPLPRVQVVPLYLLFHLMVNLLLVSDELEKILSDFSDEFDLDRLVEQLPEEERTQQHIVQPGVSTEPMCPQPPCPSSGSASPVDASILSASR